MHEPCTVSIVKRLQMELRLTCLNRGECNARAQCYDVNGSEIATASTLRILTYIAFEGSSVDAAAIEAVFAQWLDLDASYVSISVTLFPTRVMM